MIDVALAISPCTPPNDTIRDEIVPDQQKYETFLNSGSRLYFEIQRTLTVVASPLSSARRAYGSRQRWCRSMPRRTGGAKLERHAVQDRHLIPRNPFGGAVRLQFKTAVSTVSPRVLMEYGSTAVAKSARRINVLLTLPVDSARSRRCYPDRTKRNAAQAHAGRSYRRVKTVDNASGMKRRAVDYATARNCDSAQLRRVLSTE